MQEISEGIWKEYALTHSREIRNTIAESYIRLARNVAYRFSEGKAEREDLEQVANVALLRAVESYDSGKGTAFSTYAVHMMTGEIRHYLRDKVDMIHINRTDKENLGKLAKAQDKLTRTLSREPSIREIADEMNAPAEDVLYLLEMRVSTDTMSLQNIQDEDGELTMEDMTGSADINFEKLENRELVAWLMSALTSQEKMLVTERFVNTKNQRETAKLMGISQMSVSRMEKRIMDKLRTHLQKSEEE